MKFTERPARYGASTILLAFLPALGLLTHGLTNGFRRLFANRDTRRFLWTMRDTLAALFWTTAFRVASDLAFWQFCAFSVTLKARHFLTYDMALGVKAHRFAVLGAVGFLTFPVAH